MNPRICTKFNGPEGIKFVYNVNLHQTNLPNYRLMPTGQD